MYLTHQGRAGFRGSAQTSEQADSNMRFRIARAGLFGFGALLIVRLFTLQIVDVNMYRTLASDQREIYRDLFPMRGEILMQDQKSGQLMPLATNKDVYLVYADPRLIVNPEKVAKKIAPILGIEKNSSIVAPDQVTAESDLITKKIEDEYQQLLARLSKKDDPYEPIKHGVEESVAEEINKLDLPGISTVSEPIRYYPFKNIGAHLTGFVGSDGEKMAGRYGIEGTFEKELAGTPGFFNGEKDLGGRWIPVGNREMKTAIDGASVVLTIDRAIQYFACTKLNEAVKRHGASGGSVVILEAKTGAILAMCGAPDFDPNEYSKVDDIEVYKNPVTMGQYEPGSVFKVITMAAALDAGVIDPETTYEDTGSVVIGPNTIKNADHKAHGVKTMTQVLESSLNTGAIFAARKVGVDKYRDYVERFGFGQATEVRLGRESIGDVAALQKRGEIYLATASFGQGIALTPMQMVSAISAIANQGKLMKPYVVKEIKNSNDVAVVTEPTVVREVISPRAAALTAGMMVSVVERGHGKRAGVPGYYVAGKTGTAQIPNKNGPGYEPNFTIGTFVGFAPVDNPKFVMLTRIDRPRDVEFAESSAAPLFGDIAKFLLQYFEIKPVRDIKGK